MCQCLSMLNDEQNLKISPKRIEALLFIKSRQRKQAMGFTTTVVFLGTQLRSGDNNESEGATANYCNNTTQASAPPITEVDERDSNATADRQSHPVGPAQASAESGPYNLHSHTPVPETNYQGQCAQCYS